MENESFVEGEYVSYIGEYDTCHVGIYKISQVYDLYGMCKFYDLDLVSVHNKSEGVYGKIYSVRVGELVRLDLCKDLDMHNYMPRLGVDNIYLGDVCIECGKML